MSTEAIHPQASTLLSVAKEMQQLKRSESDAKKGIDPEDAVLADLANMPGWRVLKNYILRIKEGLKPDYQGLAESMKDGDFFQSYGMRTVIYDILAEQLDAVIEKVEGTEDVVTQERASQ